MAEVRGRPLRALAVVLGGWVAVRVVLLWPAGEVMRPPAPRIAAVERARPLLPVIALEALAVPVRLAEPGRQAQRGLVVPLPSPAPVPPALPASPAPTDPAEVDTGYTLALAGLVQYGAAEPARGGPLRWSGSAWAILRGAGGTGGVATPQLGGSQAGVRLAYALNDRFAVAGRVASAIGTRQQDAAIGVEWRPTSLPVRIVAEQRIGIAGARGGASVGIVGGVDAARLPLGLTLDSYAQAGAIARDGGEGYADGAVRVGRRVGAIGLGIGAWGAAQRGARRLDIGPSVAVVVPVEKQRIRLSLDWRARIVGNARPRSGPALSIGTDF